MAARAVALLAGGLTLACASVSIQRLEPATTQRAPTTGVILLHGFPSTPYQALARIEVRDRGLGRSAAALRAKLMDAASQLGANAVVLEPTSTRRSVGGSPGPIGLYDDVVFAGTAIVHQPSNPVASQVPRRP
jgi:hypothetical protein